MPPHLDCALVQNEDPVVVEDGVEPVGDGEERLALQLAEQRLLHQRVSLLVHRGSRLVQEDQLQGDFVYTYDWVQVVGIDLEA